MDRSDFMDELNNMASIIDSIMRWQEVFGYTYDEALKRLLAQRSSGTELLTIETWESVREEQEASGHDMESYEHSIQLRHRSISKKTKGRAIYATFLFVLQNPLDSAETIQDTFNLASTPKAFKGLNDDSEEVRFCRVSSATKQQILERYNKIQEQHFILDNYALKDLSDYSRYPTLGIDTTLPQYRPIKATDYCMPLQTQYPVWYFFYGTLGEPERLSRLLQLVDVPKYHGATVRGGRLTTWADKYSALIDSSSEDSVRGVAYEVKCPDDEMRLQYYETNKYEVVRAEIMLELEGDRETVPGLTFRFIQ